SYREGDPKVYLMNIETGQREIVSNFPGMTFSPRFSPDGQRVIFSLQRGGSSNLFVMDLRSKATTRLTDTQVIDTAPSYSPDGTGERILTEGYHSEGPTWAPNGRVIMFFRDPGGNAGPMLYTVDVTGRNEQILKTPSYASDPAWSPLLQ